MTPLGRTLRHLYATSGHTSLTEWCQCVGVSYGTIRHWMRTETEPTWLRTLRTIKRRTGLTWGELLDGHSWERRAVRVNVSNKQTGYATGHSECSACGCHVSPIARYCEGCGARFMDKEEHE